MYFGFSYRDVYRREPTLDEWISVYSFQYNVDKELVRDIIRCESGFNSEAINTKAVRGQDIGIWQINTYYWEEELLKQGFNIHDPKDNLEAGFYLLSKYGSKLWDWSKHCWLADN